MPYPDFYPSRHYPLDIIVTFLIFLAILLIYSKINRNLISHPDPCGPTSYDAYRLEKR